MFSEIPFPKSNEPQPTPMVYLPEDATWEYKILACSLDDLPGEEAMNALGADGWELTSTLNTASQVYFYFKRLS
jgi:hypothetical protein